MAGLYERACESFARDKIFALSRIAPVSPIAFSLFSIFFLYTPLNTEPKQIRKNHRRKNFDLSI